jgi:hypothetical protein
LTSFFFCASGELQKAQWRGKTVKEADLTIIENPAKPLYGELVLELDEDLAIGNPEENNYSFSRVRGIAVDSQANIYASDADKGRVQEFDGQGRYAQTIGRSVLRQPMKILLNEETGLLYVLDNFNIKVFEKNGVCLGPKDNIFAVTYPSSARIVSFSEMSAEGKVLKELARFPYEPKTVVYFEGMLPGNGRTGIDYDLFAAQIDSQTFIYGYSREYELNTIDDQGKITLRIRKDEPYRQFSKSLRRSEGSLLPPHQPFFHSLFTDGEGLIFVQRNFPTIMVDKRCDVFSLDGYFLYETTIPKGIQMIRGGYLYAFESGKIHDRPARLIKRYKIKNWQSIKRGIKSQAARAGGPLA